jgi:hypothetical protein
MALKFSYVCLMDHKFVFSVLTLSLLTCNLSAFSATEKKVVLKEDTKISAVLTKSISSGSNAVAGQPIEAEITEDVVVDDRVLIKKGTPVKGSISAIQRAQRLGKGGNISLQLTSVKTVDEQKVTLRSGLGRDLV